ncbi:MAG: hypothetical protein HY316_04190 [Acidobacteria bacterium]|nr:hypothetical protein [Acidobacteriota bacterium]
MKGRKHWIAITAVIIIGAVVVAWMVLLRFRKDARDLLRFLPPDADAYAVFDLDILQSNPALKKLLAEPPDVSPATDYQQLLRQTGFRYQSDLRQLATAKLGRDWVGTTLVDVDRPRWVSYLESQGAEKSELEGRTVYSFGTEHPFRLIFLDDRLVAFAVGGEPALLMGVLDRFAGNSPGSAAEELGRNGLLDRYPANNGLWFVGRMERLLALNPEGPSIGPFQFGKDWWEGSKMVIASVVSSPLHLDVHLENQCQDAASAERMANAFQAVLAIVQAVRPPEGTSNGTDYSPLLAALTIRQADESVFMDWHWDASMLALLAGESR